MKHDPGGKSQFPLKPGVTGDAYVTDDERHRIWLSRIWGPGHRYALLIGMNPSTARADVDDQTIIRDMGFVQRWGFDGYFKGNVSSYRATSPKSLLESGVVLSHDDNLPMLRKLAGRCSKIVACWGAIHPRLQPLAAQLIAQLLIDKRELWCLGTTKHGQPRHTLYLKSDTQLQLFRGPME